MDKNTNGWESERTAWTDKKIKSSHWCKFVIADNNIRKKD